MTEYESRSSSESPVRRERWVWWLAAALFIVALALYARVDRYELYEANLTWWSSVARLLLPG